MAGPDGKDPACVPLPLVPVALPVPATPDARHPAPLVPQGALSAAEAVPAPGVDGVPRPPIRAWRDVTVFTLSTGGPGANCIPWLSSAVEPAVAAAVERAVAVLTGPTSDGGYGAQRGAPLFLPDFKDAFDIWSATLTAADQPSFRALMDAGHGGRLHLGQEMIRWAFGASEATIPALVLAFIEDIPARLLPGRHAALLRTAAALRASVHETLAAANGVLILPAQPGVAPLHDEAWLRPHNCGYTGFWNVLEVPATAVPMGLDGRGLPVAVQVVGGRGYDQLTVAVACALEAAGAGWAPPRVAYAEEPE